MWGHGFRPRAGAHIVGRYVLAGLLAIGLGVGSVALDVHDVKRVVFECLAERDPVVRAILGGIHNVHGGLRLGGSVAAVAAGVVAPLAAVARCVRNRMRKGKGKSAMGQRYEAELSPASG